MIVGVVFAFWLLHYFATVIIFSCRIYVALYFSCYVIFVFFLFFYLDLIHLNQESFRNNLYLHEVIIRLAYTLSFPNSTFWNSIGDIVFVLSKDIGDFCFGTREPKKEDDNTTEAWWKMWQHEDLKMTKRERLLSLHAHTILAIHPIHHLIFLSTFIQQFGFKMSFSCLWSWNWARVNTATIF